VSDTGAHQSCVAALELVSDTGAHLSCVAGPRTGVRHLVRFAGWPRPADGCLTPVRTSGASPGLELVPDTFGASRGDRGLQPGVWHRCAPQVCCGASNWCQKPLRVGTTAAGRRVS